jgi:LuxR family maltose regulon positive regulatory protein
VPGEADREADALEKYLAVYSPLTDGHGSGADILFRAELAYHRGGVAEAEILCYKAVYLAESKRQSIVQMGAAMVLAHIALHKADTMGWQQALDTLERAGPSTRKTPLSAGRCAMRSAPCCSTRSKITGASPSGCKTRISASTACRRPL